VLYGTQEKLQYDQSSRMSQLFPQAVIAEKMIFLSGTPGFDLHAGKVISDNFEDQTSQCIQNIKIILEEARTKMSKVIKTTIFMVAGNDFSIVNKVYTEYFPEYPPARTTPQVMPFPAGILISIECIALP
jgi:2-iminobutanoate/2-iminopropanoate deaminase